MVDWLLVVGCFVCAPVVAWATLRAQKSGVIRAQRGEIIRSEQPRTFQVAVIVGWCLSGFCVVLGVVAAAVFGLVPAPK